MPLVDARNAAPSKSLAKAMAFLGGTLHGMDRDAAQTANEHGISFAQKHDYKSEVARVINDNMSHGLQHQPQHYPQMQYQQPIQTQQPINMPVQQPIYYQQPQMQMPVYQQSMQIASEINMSDYINDGNNNKTNNPKIDLVLLATLNEANKPIIARLEILCQMLGKKIYPEIQRTNTILNSAASPQAPVEEYYPEEEEVNTIQTPQIELTQSKLNKTPEDEIAELDAMSRAMMPEDVLNPDSIGEVTL